MTMITPATSIAYTATQKRSLAERKRALVAALAEGRRGMAKPVALKTFLKQARKKFPHLAG